MRSRLSPSPSMCPRTSARQPPLPAVADVTGRILSQYNVGAPDQAHGQQQLAPRRFAGNPSLDAERRGVWRAMGRHPEPGRQHRAAGLYFERLKPGVVYTTFHHPLSGANVITTDNSDWATNCPEYKVTAVQVMRVTEPSAWQARQRQFDCHQQQLLDAATPIRRAR